MRSGILILVAALLPAAGAAAQSRLDPVEEQPGELAEYRDDLRRVFKEAFAKDVRLRAIVQPSFQLEYAVGLRQAGGRYEIFALRPSRQIWAYQQIALFKSGKAGVFVLDGGDPGKGQGEDLLGDPDAELRDATAGEIARLQKDLPADPADLPLTRCTAAVDARIAASVTGAWRRMLEAVRPGDDLPVGADGTTYQFSMEAGGRSLVGETWSPKAASRAGRLARLAEAMRAYCETPQSDRLNEIGKLARGLG